MTDLFSPPVEALIADYTARLAGGYIEIWHLPYPLNDLAWTALDQMPTFDQLRDELARERDAADRLYRVAFGPRPAIPDPALIERRRQRRSAA